MADADEPRHAVADRAADRVDRSPPAGACRPATARPAADARPQSGSSSASRSRTTSASSAAPGAGGTLAVRDEHDRHPGRPPGRGTPLLRVLDHEAVARVDAQPPGRLEVDVRGRLAVGDLVGRDHDREGVGQPGRLERGVDDRAVRRRRHRDRPVGGDPPDGLDGAVDAGARPRLGSGRPSPSTIARSISAPGRSRSSRSRMIRAQPARVGAHHRGLVVAASRSGRAPRRTPDGPRPTRSRSRRGPRRGRR